MLAYTPGESSRHTDGTYYLISRIVEKKTGMTISNFLLEELFFDLGKREVSWSTCPMDHPMGATGYYIHSEAAVKTGQIYLRRGTFNGKHYLSKEWNDTVLERKYEFHRPGNGFSSTKSGMAGQMPVVIPEKNNAIAWHTYIN